MTNVANVSSVNPSVKEIVFSRISKTENVFLKRTGVIWGASRKEYDLGVQVNRSDTRCTTSCLDAFTL